MCETAEQRVAVRLCTECDMAFCEQCFAEAHGKGARRRHMYLRITYDMDKDEGRTGPSPSRSRSSSKSPSRAQPEEPKEKPAGMALFDKVQERENSFDGSETGELPQQQPATFGDTVNERASPAKSALKHVSSFGDRLNND